MSDVRTDAVPRTASPQVARNRFPLPQSSNFTSEKMLL